MSAATVLPIEKRWRPEAQGGATVTYRSLPIIGRRWAQATRPSTGTFFGAESSAAISSAAATSKAPEPDCSPTAKDMMRIMIASQRIASVYCPQTEPSARIKSGRNCRSRKPAARRAHFGIGKHQAPWLSLPRAFSAAGIWPLLRQAAAARLSCGAFRSGGRHQRGGRVPAAAGASVPLMKTIS